jgi:hypothetical protein
MNFASERNKPIFVARPVRVSAFNSQGIINEALANSTVIRAKDSGDYIVKAAAARRLPHSLLLSVAEASPEEIKDLIVSRLETDKDEKFQFLDGKVFSGADAAKEVAQNTRVGKYFLELETETLRIVQEAFLKGEII